VLSLTLTGFAADSALAGGEGSKPHRRLGSIVAMLAGAPLGAWLLQWSPSTVIGLAALAVLGVAVVFAPAPAPGTAGDAGAAGHPSGSQPLWRRSRLP